MTVRLNRLVTRTGDDGTTGLSDGSRLPKHHPLIAAIGSVDEASSALGLARCETLPADLAAELPTVQNDLFDLGSDLATPPDGPYEARLNRIGERHIERLEALVAASTAKLPPMNSFVLPGGSRAAACLHLARTVVRRAERELCAAEAVLPETARRPLCRRYLNRLSDLCFAWARRANDDGRADLPWVPGANG
jgi:cob(I)alamin adenosyltransferase